MMTANSSKIYLCCIEIMDINNQCSLPYISDCELVEVFTVLPSLVTCQATLDLFICKVFSWVVLDMKMFENHSCKTTLDSDV